MERAPQGISQLTLPIPETSPLAKHHPVTRACESLPIRTAPVTIPESLNSKTSEPWSETNLRTHVLELSEWLSLVALQSPRVHTDDEIDPYLSRYSRPEGDLTEIKKLVILKWSGFIPAEWLRQLFIVCM